MKSYQKFIASGLILAGLAVGCAPRNTNSEAKVPVKSAEFASVPMWYESGMAMTSGDFDNDGDLDLIVGAKGNAMTEAQLYRFNNDRKGNFSQ